VERLIFAAIGETMPRRMAEETPDSAAATLATAASTIINPGGGHRIRFRRD
jgi:hypothetical protein